MIALLPLILSKPDIDPSSRSLLRTMAKRYLSTVSMKGKIVNAVSDGTGVVTTVTDFAYVKPSRVSLTQTTNATKGGTYRLASDGVKFSYDRPVDLANERKAGARAVEPVRKDHTAVGKDGTRYVDSFYMMTVPDMYVAASHSLPDASPVHDLILGVQGSTETWLRGLDSVSAPEPAVLDGEKVTKISGTYRSVRLTEDTSPVSVKFSDKLTVNQQVKSVSVPGTFAFYIGSDNLLRRFMTVENYVVDKKDVRLASVWDATVTLNPDIPLKAFTSY